MNIEKNSKMNKQVASYRRILKSSSIIGTASIISIIIGLIRTKVLALLLGPAGFGLVSLYTSLLSTATTIASMGIGTVGTRQIAEAKGQGNEDALSIIHRTMFWGMLLLAVASALLVWTFRELLSIYVLGGIEHSTAVGWLSFGVALSVASMSQGALLQGMQRIGDMARLTVYSAVVNTILGLIVLWQWREGGLIAYILISPLVSFILGHWFVSRLPKIHSCSASIQELSQRWQIMLRLGIPFMAAGVMGALVQLWIRIEIGNTLGTESLGHFQAAWVLSMQYVGFVLGAMSADYYPRLTQVIHNHKTATNLINEQTEIALLLSAPVIIVLIGLTPWVIQLLYSAAFMPAVEILRWQIMGDVFKIASWPLGFVLLATGAGKTFFLTEAFYFLLVGVLVAGFIGVIGLQITGIAFLAGYVFYLPLVYLLARQRIGFQWSYSVMRLLVIIFILCVSIAVISVSFWWGGILALALSIVFAVYSLSRIAHMTNMKGRIGHIASKMKFLW